MPSAALATLVTQMYGISFTALDPQIDEPLTVPSGDRSGLLTGVAQLSIWRVTPQRVSGNAAAVVESADGPLAAAVGR